MRMLAFRLPSHELPHEQQRLYQTLQVRRFISGGDTESPSSYLWLHLFVVCQQSALTAMSTAETLSGMLPAGIVHSVNTGCAVRKISFDTGRNHDQTFLDYLQNIVSRVQQLPMGGVLVIPVRLLNGTFH
jgi:hypothetical protein